MTAAIQIAGTRCFYWKLKPFRFKGGEIGLYSRSIQRRNRGDCAERSDYLPP